MPFNGAWHDPPGTLYIFSLDFETETDFLPLEYDLASVLDLGFGGISMEILPLGSPAPLFALRPLAAALLSRVTQRRENHRHGEVGVV